MITLDQLVTPEVKEQDINITVKDNKISISGLEYQGKPSESGKSTIVTKTNGAQYVNITTSNGNKVRARLQLNLYVVKK